MKNLPEMRNSILVIDYNNDILESISERLDADYQVIKVNNDLDAMNILENHHIDLILSNVFMPSTEDFKLCATLKENINYSHIPFIILTAITSIESKIEGLAYGIDAYVESHITAAYIKAQINNLLTSRRRIYEHYSKSPLVALSNHSSNKSDYAFLEKINHFILEHISEHSLCVDLLADKMNMSRPTLYRKIKNISNISPNELINMSRLMKATEYLLNQEFKIYEIATLVGFNSSSHFTRNFHKQFGISPKEYVNSLHN